MTFGTFSKKVWLNCSKTKTKKVIVTHFPFFLPFGDLFAVIRSSSESQTGFELEILLPQPNGY